MARVARRRLVVRARRFLTRFRNPHFAPRVRPRARRASPRSASTTSIAMSAKRALGALATLATHEARAGSMKLMTMSGHRCGATAATTARATVAGPTRARLARDAMSRDRAYATRRGTKSSSSADEAASGTRGDLASTPESGRYDEITDKWIPEKPVSVVEGASYGAVGLIGLGIAAGAVWYGASELLVTPREQKVFNAAMDKLHDDVRVTVALGSPMTGYGSESRSRSARHRIAHRVVIDERGRERLRVQFHARGARGSAVVHAEAGLDESTGKWEFQYIIVDVQGANPTRIHVVSPQARPRRLVAL
tara:strand:- start:285 stop:1208 length:924 start_codon:yes stop_codon:yes gene_type:complete